MKSYQNSVDDPTFYHSFLRNDEERKENRRSSASSFNPILLICLLTAAFLLVVFNLSSEDTSTFENAVGNPGRITDAELGMIVQALAAADVELSADYQDLNSRISFVDALPVNDPDNADAQACAKIEDKRIYIKSNTDDSGDKRLSYLKTVAHETSHLMHFVQGWDISPLGAVGAAKQFTPYLVDVGHHPAGRDATFLTEVRAHYVQLAFEKMFVQPSEQTRLAGRYDIWVSKGLIEVTIPVTGVDGTNELTQIDVRTMSRNAMGAKPECEVTGAHVTWAEPNFVVKIMGLTVPMEAHVKSGDFGKRFAEDLATRKSNERLKNAVVGTITDRVIQDRNPLYKNGASVNGDRDYVITEIADKYKLHDVTPDGHVKLFLFFDAQNWKEISELTKSADLGGGKVLELAAFQSDLDEMDVEPDIIVDGEYPSPAEKAKKTQKS